MSKVKKHCPMCGEITKFEESADAAICEKCGTPFITANAIEIEVDDGLVDAKCTNCGAALRVDPTKEAAICEYCGSAYIVKKAIKNYEVTINNTTYNNYVADVVNVVNNNNYVPINASTEISRAFKLEKEKSKEEFKRDVLIALSAETDSPNDIADINILDIEEFEVEAVFGDVHVDLSYTATIGYDRQEQYLDTVNEYDPDLKETVTKTVVKTRTVTDWHPHSGQRTAEEDGFAPLDSKYSELEFRKAVQTVDKSKISSIDVKTLKKTRVDDAVIQSIKDECVFSVSYNAERDLPGDHKKDFNYSAACEIKELVYYKVPYYLMKYEYKGKQYAIGSIPCGAANFVLAARPKSEGNIEDQASSASKPLKFGEILSWVAFGIICGLALILGYTNSSYWLGYIVLVPFATGITFMMLCVNKYNTLLEKSFNDKLGILKKNLKKSLNKHELEPLTKEEEKIFSLEDNLNEREFNAKKRKKKNWVIVLTSIITIIMLLFTIFGTINHSKTTSHSPETIEMSLTSYSTSQDGYYSYVDFNYSIKSKKYNLSSMKFTTHVYNSGKEVLSIESSLYSMNLSSGSAKSFCLQSEEYSTNATIYSAFNKSQSYTYKFEITWLDFDDGENYYASKEGAKNINNIIEQKYAVSNKGSSSNGSNSDGSGGLGNQTSNTYTITYDVNGGNALESNTQQVTYNSTYTLPTPTRVGYTFAGWYNGSTKYINGTWKTTNNVILTAKWQANTYTITFDVNGGNALESNTQQVTYNSTYTLPTPTRVGYTFAGWYNGETQVNSVSWLNNPCNISLTAKWIDSKYNPIIKKGVLVSFEYGEYPQTIKESSVTIDESSQDSRGYYLGSDGAYYAKVTAKLYTSGYTYSNGITITSGNVYYFKVEPIKWKVLYNADGTYLVMSDLILDSQCYYKSTSNRSGATDYQGNSTSSTVYANNYKYSDIRTFLNTTFINQAFTSEEQNIIKTTRVDNSVSSTGYDSNDYVCEDTQDKIFLLSASEAMNTTYGFTSSTSSTNSRYAKGTDYAKARGLYVYTTTGYDYTGNSYWWLRSPYVNGSNYARYVDCDGSIGNSFVYYSLGGVRPALNINL